MPPAYPPTPTGATLSTRCSTIHQKHWLDAYSGTCNVLCKTLIVVGREDDINLLIPLPGRYTAHREGEIRVG